MFKKARVNRIDEKGFVRDYYPNVSKEDKGMLFEW